MPRIVHAPIGDVDDALVVLDARRRLYAGLSRDGAYWHVVAPLQFDQFDLDGNVARRAGEFACVCKGATFHGHCYRIRQAEAFELGERHSVAWLDDAPTVAPETELERAGARG